jgi:nucleoside-diphosphate-sugar epimerase
MWAFVVGGSGLVGRAISRRLVSAGWDVDVVGRTAGRLPTDLAAHGRFFAVDRSDGVAVAAAFGAGADLLVDCICYTRAQATALLPLAGNAGSTVMISSKAVYADATGRHSNSDNPPQFNGPIAETQATVAPSDIDFNSREGYGRNKVAAENVLLVFVKRVLDQREVVLLAGRGRGVDHPSAAANIAALVETVAAKPGQRILNAADPDAPCGAEIARVVARHLGHAWREVLLDDDVPAPLGWHPWSRRHPVVLDMSAALNLGYVPVGDFACTVRDEIDWLTSIAERAGEARLLHDWNDGRLDSAFDYASEDRFLANR